MTSSACVGWSTFRRREADLMKAQVAYPPGVPCWVETLQADPQAAIGPGPMPDADGHYYVARVGGQDVAGIATLPKEAGAPAWTTYVRVDDADAATARAERAGGAI